MKIKKKRCIIYNDDLHFPEITVHGRFQPPLHKNHYNYVTNAFKIADKVQILITNPLLSDGNCKEALHRNSKENNPFTYKDRVDIFKKFFDKINMPESRYNFTPFEITKDKTWNNLDRDTPNLVNTYSEWSCTKIEKFKKLDFIVIHSSIPRARDISGSKIRIILRENVSYKIKKKKLIDAGYIAEAIDGLFEVTDRHV
ncbi:hypothetical protein K8R62_00715 [bacterium]|nr:hypothetical protein [bacterium]